MHSILTLKKWGLVGLVTVALSMFALSGSAAAQEGEVTPSDQAEKVEETFDVYTAVEGDNVTELVRRSIIEYDQSNDDIELSTAQVVFAETNIVQDMKCGDIIHVGQEVSVSQDKIKAYSAMSTELTEAETANWNGYAESVSLVLSDRTVAQATQQNATTTNGGSGSGIASEESGEEEQSEDSEDGGDDKDHDDDDHEHDDDDDHDHDDDDKDKKDGDSDWYWWILGGGAALGGWHLLGRQRKS